MWLKNTFEQNHLEISGSIPPTNKKTNNTYYNLTLDPDIVNWIRKIYSRGLNYMFSPRFRVGFWVQHGIPEEGWMTYRPKRSGHNNEDEENSINIRSDGNVFFYILTNQGSFFYFNFLKHFFFILVVKPC